MIHVKSIHAVNFGNIENLLAEFEVHDLLVIKGANGAGKSTFIEGFWQVLRQKFPIKPVKSGSGKGGMKITLDDGHVIQYVAVMGGDELVSNSLTVTNDAGRVLGAAEKTAYLRSLIGGVGSGFDVNEFLRVIGTKPAREMLGKLSIQCGADIAAIEKAKMHYDGVFKDRTVAKNNLDAQKARALPYNEDLAAKELVSAADLSAQKSAIEKHNDTYYQAQAALVGIEKQSDQSDALQVLVDEFAKEKAAMEAEIKRIQDKFKAYEDSNASKIEALLETEKAANERLKKAQSWIGDPANAPKPTDEIDAQLNDLTSTNEAISESKRKANEHAELAKLQAIWDTRNEAVKSAELAKTAAVAACKLPAGLSFSDDGENLNYINSDGVLMPLEKASEAQKIMIGVELQLSQMGDLGFFTANCSALDPRMLQDLGEMLRAKGIDGAFEVRANTMAEMGLHIELLEDHLGIPVKEKPTEAPPATLF